MHYRDTDTVGLAHLAPDRDYRFQPGDIVLVVTNTATETDIHNTFQ